MLHAPLNMHDYPSHNTTVTVSWHACTCKLMTYTLTLQILAHFFNDFVHLLFVIHSTILQNIPSMNFMLIMSADSSGLLFLTGCNGSCCRTNLMVYTRDV